MNTRIFNLNGKPFNNFEVAAKMRDLLSQENPQHSYRVELHDPEDSSKGFVVERQRQTVVEDTAKKTVDDSDKPGIEKPSAQDDQQVSFGRKKRNEAVNEAGGGEDHETVVRKVYHPALRTYLLHIPLIAAGLWILIFTEEVWITVLSQLGLKSLPAWINGSALVSGTRLLVGVWTAWLIVSILLNFYGTALVVDEQGVTLKKGIITRDETNVRFDEIRTIGLKQGILDRLLNIGMLEFASSGTDEMDIRFFNIPNPQGVKKEIEAIIRQYRN